MLSFRRVTQSKALVALARVIHSPSNSTPEVEGLFKYTRGRWLYNERERE